MLAKFPSLQRIFDAMNSLLVHCQCHKKTVEMKYQMSTAISDRQNKHSPVTCNQTENQNTKVAYGRGPKEKRIEMELNELKIYLSFP